MRSSIVFLSLLLVGLGLMVPAWAGVQCSTDDSLDVADAADLDPAGDWTLTAWIHPTDWGGNNAGRVVDHRGSVTNDGYTVAMHNVGAGEGVATLGFGINSTAVNYTYGADNALSLSTWQHVAVTYTASTAANQLYVNGVITTSSQTPFPETLLPSSDPFRLCNRTGTSFNRGFNGGIDEIHLWSGVLTAAQLTRLAHSKLRNAALPVAQVIALPLTQCAHGASIDGVSFADATRRPHTAVGDNGANNTGLTCDTMGAGLRYQRGVE